MAQLEAARAQQAAEAACIGLTLDEEKITSLSASTRRHLQGLAIVVQVGYGWLFRVLGFVSVWGFRVCLCLGLVLQAQGDSHLVALVHVGC
jgi:hypothetical protein